MDQNQIWVLMARKLAGEASPADLLELERLLEDHPRYQFALELTQTYWQQHPDQPLSEGEIEGAIDRIVGAGDEAPKADEAWMEWERDWQRRRARRRKFRVGIGTLLVLGVGIWWWSIPNTMSKPEAMERALRERSLTGAKETQVQTRMGTRTNLLLPDGTSVWLNAGSVLTYPAAFASTEREVSLDGEAFFDVVKDAKHPFIVHTSTMNIRVLGTSFDVKAYAQDREMETTLIHGAVEITRKDAPNAPRIMLKPNEKLIFHTLTKAPGGMAPASAAPPEVNHLEVTTLKPFKTPDDVIETAWMHNRLEFRGDSFEELAVKMERWYNVRIQFSEEALMKYRFYGSFEKETVTQALEALKLTATFNYKADGNDIEILP